MSHPSPYKNFARDGSKVVSFWLHPPEIKHLDELAEQNGGNRTEALRQMIQRDVKRSKRKTV